MQIYTSISQTDVTIHSCYSPLESRSLLPFLESIAPEYPELSNTLTPPNPDVRITIPNEGGCFGYCRFEPARAVVDEELCVGDVVVVVAGDFEVVDGDVPLGSGDCGDGSGGVVALGEGVADV